MEYIYAALFLHKLGKEINEENLKKVIEAAGAQIDESKIKVVIASLKGVDIEKVLKEAAAMPASTPSSESGKEKPEEKPKEEKKEEAAEGLAALFG